MMILRLPRQVVCFVVIGLLLAGCSGSMLSTPAAAFPTAALPTMPAPVPSAALPDEADAATPAASAAAVETPLVEEYEPVPTEVCQMLQQAAAEALGVDVSLETSAPFLDTIASEGGQGCRLTAGGNGSNFSDPSTTMAALTGSVGLGWNEQPAYQADGPTGAATALTRDMALMQIEVNWAPAEGVACPPDQPIAECNLTSEQRIYTIKIDIAQYQADFSLDGHWEDAATGFSLDLYQEWKHIYGKHIIVAQGGNKIDSLDVSIDGYLQDKTVDVTFQSSFTTDSGEAQITYLDVNTITWKIIAPPEGEYYLPAEATLTRK